MWLRLLNKQFKDALYSKSIPEEQLREIHAKLVEDNRKKKKIMNIVMIAIILFMGLTSVYTYSSRDVSVGKYMIIFSVVIVVVIYVLLYILMFAVYNWQYNSAIKKNYSEIADELKL